MSRRQIMLLVAPIVVVLVGWVALSWFPQHQRRDDASAQVEESQTRSENAIVQLAAARRLAAVSKATQAELAELTARIPEEPDIGGFVLMNQAIARDTKVVLTDVTPQTDIEDRFLPGADELPATLQPIVVSITATGSFDQVWTYVGRLTEADRLVVIDSIALDAERVGVLRCSLLVRIFTTQITTDETAEPIEVATP